MIDTFLDRQATDGDLFELEDVQTGEKRQYRIVSKATVTQSGTNLSAATFNPILDAINGKLDKSGGTLTGALTTQDVLPDSGGIRNIGNTSKRYATVYAGNGNFGGQLAAGSAMLSGALTTQDIVPDNNNSRNLGTDSKRYKSIKAFVGSFGEQITSQSGIFDNYLEVQGNEVWHNGEITSTTTTIKGGAGTSYTLQLYKIGRLVIISSPSWISLGSSTASGATLGTIPAGWRPASEAHGALIDADNDGVIRFATDGKILANNNASNVYCGYLCNVVYMTP